MPKVKVTVQFAVTKIITHLKMLISSFLYSSITLTVNISDKPEKWGSIFISHENPKENDPIV